jgi:two-component system, OmpR family, phosphate regulon sensor histidine kinase PhoR
MTTFTDAQRADLHAIRTRVLNVVGHELRTPVTTLRGLADTLASIDDEDTRAALVLAIQRNATRLERLVDDLLVASDITTALPTGPTTPVDVVGVVRVAWAELGGGVLAVEPQTEVVAWAHPEGLTRALRCVLENARELGEPPVSVRAWRAAGTTVIEVHSPGTTPHPEELRLATEPLYRGEAAVLRRPGLGLGLAVARALVEQSGGQLVLTARDGGGVVTRLTLPSARTS